MSQMSLDDSAWSVTINPTSADQVLTLDTANKFMSSDVRITVRAAEGSDDTNIVLNACDKKIKLTKLLDTGVIAVPASATYQTSNLSKYNYLVFALDADATENKTDDSDGYLEQFREWATEPIAIISYEYFKTNPLTMHFATGSSGSASYREQTVTYVDDTHVTQTRVGSYTISRAFRIYGFNNPDYAYLYASTGQSASTSYRTLSILMSNGFGTYGDYIIPQYGEYSFDVYSKYTGSTASTYNDIFSVSGASRIVGTVTVGTTTTEIDVSPSDGSYTFWTGARQQALHTFKGKITFSNEFSEIPKIYAVGKTGGSDFIYTIYATAQSSVNLVDSSIPNITADKIPVGYNTFINGVLTDGTMVLGNATSAQVLESATFTSESGANQSGTIINRGAQQDYSIAQGVTKTFEAGYYPSAWSVWAKAVESGLPSGISNITFGTDTIPSAFTTSQRLVDHELGVVPDLVIYWHNGNVATTYSMLAAMRFNQMGYRSSAYNSYYFYHGNSTTTVSMANSNSTAYGVSNLTEQTFTVQSQSTSYYWRAGTYNWMAIKFT